jgi:hypothetical protein
MPESVTTLLLFQRVKISHQHSAILPEFVHIRHSLAASDPQRAWPLVALLVSSSTSAASRNGPFQDHNQWRSMDCIDNLHRTSSRNGPFQGHDSRSADITLVLRSGGTAISMKTHTVSRHEAHVVTLPVSYLVGRTAQTA